MIFVLLVFTAFAFLVIFVQNNNKYIVIFFDRLYASIYKDIVINKKSTISGVLFFITFIYSNLFSFLLNMFSIIINHRLMKNVFYNLFLFILCYALNYLIYEKYKRRDFVLLKDCKIISTFFVNILFFISAFLFFLSIYLNNEMIK